MREQIFRILTNGPATPSAVGRQIGIAASKAHYHVGVLEKHGLVRLVETRSTAGITEKYYEAVARNIAVHAETAGGELTQLTAMVRREFGLLADDVARALSTPKESPFHLVVERVQAGPELPAMVRNLAEPIFAKVDAGSQQTPGRWYRLALVWVPTDTATYEEDT